MSGTAEPRVLVVEDNRDLALGLRVNLEEQGYAVSTAHSCSAALVSARRAPPDLIILDLALPDGDGVDLARQLRSGGGDALILMLTARSQRDAKLLGLRAGADDYVTKPFDLDELLARVSALLRRRRVPDSAEPRAADAPRGRARIGDAELDFGARVVRRDGEELPVSHIGFELLARLVARRGNVVPRSELMRDVWGYDKTVISRTLDTHIFDLRRLLEPNPATPRYIRTVWRIGYRLD